VGGVHVTRLPGIAPAETGNFAALCIEDPYARPGRVVIRLEENIVNVCDMAKLRYIDKTAAYADSVRTFYIIPDVKNFALCIKNLHAIVLAVSHVDEVFVINANAVGQVELTRRIPRFPPGGEELPLSGEAVYAGVAIAVRNENLSPL
jgi:hypothetical protein